MSLLQGDVLIHRRWQSSWFGTSHRKLPLPWKRTNARLFLLVKQLEHMSNRSMLIHREQQLLSRYPIVHSCSKDNRWLVRGDKARITHIFLTSNDSEACQPINYEWSWGTVKDCLTLVACMSYECIVCLSESLEFAAFMSTLRAVCR